MAFFLYLAITLVIVVSLFLILLILIQKGRGGGLASAFGGAGGNTAFGSKTGDVLTWATSVVFGVFLALCITLNVLGNKWQAKRAATPGAAVPAARQPGAPVSRSPAPSDQSAVPPVTGAPDTK